VRIGAGAGYSGDRIEPAVELAERGALDYLVFECLAERTIAIAQQARSKDPERGYDPLLETRMKAVLPAAVRNGVRIVSNMGAANPLAAARKTAEVARSRGLGGLKIAAVTGDDVLDAVRSGDDRFEESGERVADYRARLVAANAYLGAGALVEALEAGAQIVLTGRVADPSLFVAPLIHEFGWRMDDWPTLGQATVVGHLMECAANHRRLFRGPRFQGCSRACKTRLSDRGSRCKRRGNHYQARGCGRTRDRGDLQGAVAIRDSRSAALFATGRGRGLLGRAYRAGRPRPCARERRQRRAAHRYVESVGGLFRRFHRRGADFVCGSGCARACSPRARHRARAACVDRRADA